MHCFFREVYVTTFLVKHYDELGIAPSSLAVGTAFARAVDTAAEPLIGWLSDHVRTRHGRRRPVLALASLLAACSFVALFFAPWLAGSSAILPFYIAVFTVFRLAPISSTLAAFGVELTRSLASGKCWCAL